MKSLWIVLVASLLAPFAAAQTTIYKHIDESGRVTYSNRPMKGATVVNLEPLSTIPGLARPSSSASPSPTVSPSQAQAPATATAVTAVSPEKPALSPAVAVVTPRAAPLALASVDREPKRDEAAARRKQLESELAQAQAALADSRKSLLQEQRNPALIAAVRAAQESVDPTPAQQAEMRASIERASGRIRGLQATVAEQEKNIEALKNELGALKP